jgi:hypothetical protein
MKFWDKVASCNHEFCDNYIYYVSCGTPHCQGVEYRCKKCKAYVTECGCGYCNGISGWPEKRYRKMRLKKQLKKGKYDQNKM